MDRKITSENLYLLLPGAWMGLHGVTELPI